MHTALSQMIFSCKVHSFVINRYFEKGNAHMTILFITYIPMENPMSGSSVRPQKMYEAMLSLGFKVHILKGSQQIGNRKRRLISIKETKEWLKTNRPDLCYIESPSGPITFHADRCLIKHIVKLGIPTAYFYRDCYFRFRYFRKQFSVSPISLVKLWAILFLENLTNRVLSHIDIVYFPTMKMANMFTFQQSKPLMPAGESVQTLNSSSNALDNKPACIYVGGLGEIYGSDMLLSAFESLNDDGETYPLHLVCRKNEYYNSCFNKKYPDPPKWLIVHHVFGQDKLLPIYSKAKLALLPQRPDDYLNITIGVKMFEYLGHGLPVVSAGAVAMSQLIDEYELGVVSIFSPVEFAAAIQHMLGDHEKMREYQENVRVFMKTNQWTDRVKNVVQDLIGKV